MPFEKHQPWRSEPYRAFIRQQPCLICGSHADVQAHHENMPGESGMGQKVSDVCLLPLCGTFSGNCHGQRHSSAFKGWDYHRIDPEREIRKRLNSFLGRKI